MFRQTYKETEKHIRIKCDDNTIDCRRENFYVEVIYDRLRPSQFHGISKVQYEENELIPVTDSFRVDVFARSIKLYDQDHNGNWTLSRRHLSIGREPNILSASTAKYKNYKTL